METLIYEKLDKKRVKCQICRHFCVIKDGKRGICGVRGKIKAADFILWYIQK